MSHIPYFFTIQEKVMGDGFVVDVYARGRVLREDEEGEVSLYGVHPGGLVGVGEDLGKAYADFKNGFRSVLFDIAAKAQTYTEFKEQTRSFFNSVCKETNAQWRAAVKAVRGGKIDRDGFKNTKDADTPAVIEMREIRTPLPQENQIKDTAPELERAA